jgi:hypothetical protein
MIGSRSTARAEGLGPPVPCAVAGTFDAASRYPGERSARADGCAAGSGHAVVGHGGLQRALRATAGGTQWSCRGSMEGHAISAVCTEHRAPGAARSVPALVSRALCSPALAGITRPLMLAQTMPSSPGSQDAVPVRLASFPSLICRLFATQRCACREGTLESHHAAMPAAPTCTQSPYRDRAGPVLSPSDNGRDESSPCIEQFRRTTTQGPPKFNGWGLPRGLRMAP